MFNVCPRCGLYEVNKAIKRVGNECLALCPECGHRHSFLQLPLFVVTGASGTGKTACALSLAALTNDYVVLETDILWEERYNSPETQYREYREMWLRLAKNISQSGKPVILCGTAVPDQLEPCMERRYFSKVFYLALTCSKQELMKRLSSRPSWRESSGKVFLENMMRFNQWFSENGPGNETPIDLLDTTGVTADDTAKHILAWAQKHTCAWNLASLRSRPTSDPDTSISSACSP